MFFLHISLLLNDLMFMLLLNIRISNELIILSFTWISCAIRYSHTHTYIFCVWKEYSFFLIQENISESILSLSLHFIGCYMVSANFFALPSIFFFAPSLNHHLFLAISSIFHVEYARSYSDFRSNALPTTIVESASCKFNRIAIEFTRFAIESISSTSLLCSDFLFLFLN